MPDPHSRRRSDDPIDILLIESDDDDIDLARAAFAETERDTALHVVRSGDDAVDYVTRRGSTNRPLDPISPFWTCPFRDGTDATFSRCSRGCPSSGVSR